jgi:hypothetical protein
MKFPAVAVEGKGGKGRRGMIKGEETTHGRKKNPPFFTPDTVNDVE